MHTTEIKTPLANKQTVEPLRGKGRLRTTYTWPPTPKSDPPRALKALASIVDGDLCHRCGSCIGICPTKVLATDKQEYPIVANIDSCTDCDLCVKVCPGVEFDSKKTSEDLYGYMPKLEDIHGHFEEAHLAYSTDKNIRASSTSGGLVSALLVSLLEQDKIDGAVVIAPDEETPWKGKPIIARTKEEILSAGKSKYAICPTNRVFSEIISTPGRYALVGLPCQIHGYHKAAELDVRLKKRIVLTIGLFCHAAVEHRPMEIIWAKTSRDNPDVKKFISRVGKHPGTPHVESKDGKQTPVYFPKAKNYRPNSMEILNIMYRLYTPARCLTCYDSTAEFADIAIGDPWMPKPDDTIDFKDGYSFALIRTKRGVKALSDCISNKSIGSFPLSSEIAKRSNTMMGTEKRWRAFRIIETLRRRGKPIPNYEIDLPKASGKHFILTEFNMLSHVFCFLKSGHETAFKFILSPAGYCLLWLNNKKRSFRTWRQDFFAEQRRKYNKSL